MKRLVVKTALALVGLAVLGGAIGIVLSALGSGDAVSLGPAPNVVTGSEISGTLPARPSFEVWLARGEQITPVARSRGSSPGVATAAVNALLAGPTRAERRAGATTAVPPDTGLLGISIENGIATVDLTSEFESGGGSLSMQLRLAQVVYTLTQFSTVKKVRFQLDGEPVNVFSDEGIILDHPVGRSDYKDLAPTSPPLTGTWGMLPAAPIPAPDLVRSVWAGDEMIVFGRVDKRGPHDEILSSSNVAAAYDPKGNTWRRLAAPFSAQGYPGNWNAVWTGKEMIVLGDVNQAFDPEKNRWRRLPPAPAGRAGIAIWTGKELIEWGGGCCGDVSDDGAAYDPSTNKWRKIALPPVGGQQSPVGAWTGKELVIFPGRDPDGEARSAALRMTRPRTPGVASARTPSRRPARRRSGKGTRCSWSRDGGRPACRRPPSPTIPRRTAGAGSLRPPDASERPLSGPAADSWSGAARRVPERRSPCGTGRATSRSGTAGRRSRSRRFPDASTRLRCGPGES